MIFNDQVLELRLLCPIMFILLVFDMEISISISSHGGLLAASPSQLKETILAHQEVKEIKVRRDKRRAPPASG